MQEYMQALAEAQSIDRLWALHCDAMAPFGFDRVIYGLTRVAGPNGSLGDFADALVLSNHDRAYNEAFLETQMFLDAPGLRWARNTAGAISWAALWRASESLSERERQVVAFHRSMDVTAGYTLGFAQDNARTFAMVSLTGRRGLDQAELDAVWARDGARIWTMNAIMHLKMLSLPRVDTGAALSHRQREALEWVGEGKSYQDIAEIMGVTMATVEKHLRLAREKLKVGTTAQAVLKAAFQNQIYVKRWPVASGRRAARSR